MIQNSEITTVMFNFMTSVPFRGFMYLAALFQIAGVLVKGKNPALLIAPLLFLGVGFTAPQVLFDLSKNQPATQLSPQKQPSVAASTKIESTDSVKCSSPSASPCSSSESASTVVLDQPIREKSSEVAGVKTGLGYGTPSQFFGVLVAAGVLVLIRLVAFKRTKSTTEGSADEKASDQNSKFDSFKPDLDQFDLKKQFFRS